MTIEQGKAILEHVTRLGGLLIDVSNGSARAEIRAWNATSAVRFAYSLRVQTSGAEPEEDLKYYREFRDRFFEAIRTSAKHCGPHFDAASSIN